MIHLLTTPFHSPIKYHRLNHRLQIKNIMVAEQYGYRKGLSIEHVAYTLIDNIFKAWNSKFHVGGIFYGLVKASNFENRDFNNEIAVLWTSGRKH